MLYGVTRKDGVGLGASPRSWRAALFPSSSISTRCCRRRSASTLPTSYDARWRCPACVRAGAPMALVPQSREFLGGRRLQRERYRGGGHPRARARAPSASAMAAHVLRTRASTTRRRGRCSSSPIARRTSPQTRCCSGSSGCSALTLSSTLPSTPREWSTRGATSPTAASGASRRRRQRPWYYRFSLRGSHADSPRISRERLEERLAAREFGAVIFGSASRTTSLLPTARALPAVARRVRVRRGYALPAQRRLAVARAFSGSSARARRCRRPPMPRAGVWSSSESCTRRPPTRTDTKR